MNNSHVVFHSTMTDWGFPEKWIMTEVTPPHTIEPDVKAIRAILAFLPSCGAEVDE